MAQKRPPKGARNPARKAAPKKTARPSRAAPAASASSAKTTVSGPSGKSAAIDTRNLATTKMSGTEALAEEFPFNAAKPAEFENEPPRGQRAEPIDPIVGASTLSETNPSQKVGDGVPPSSRASRPTRR